MKHTKLGAILASLVLGQAVPAVAQDFPNKVIEVSVWASAGGGTDTINRLIAKEMEAELGGNLIVSNRTGGGGAVAMNYVWNKEHDGYNWLGSSEGMQSVAVMGYHPSLSKDWRWYMVAGASAVLAVPADSPYQTIDDFVAAAKAAPGQINVTGCPVACVFHMKTLGFSDASGIEVNYNPYGGSAPAIVALLSGDGDAVMASISETAEYFLGGQLRPLAMIEMEPYDLKDFGTIPAAGATFPDVALIPARQWLGFAVPADTPKEVTDKIDAAFERAMKTPAIIEFSEQRNIGLFGLYGDAAQEVLGAMEAGVAWRLQDLGIAKVSPESLGIPRP